jgi:4-hydroxy-2-oxoheptanedioate aldolase
VKNLLKRKLAAGGTAVGTWCMLPSSFTVDVIASAGMDFVVIDMEHGAMSYQTAEEMVRAAEAHGCQPVVRVGEGTDADILHALEIGSNAVLVPHVSTAAEARRVAAAARYAPEGSRGLSPYTRNHGYTHVGLAESMRAANENVLVGVLVEGREGLKNLASIARVKGLDVVYLGVYDLSQSLGVPGRLDHPKVMAAVETCARLLGRAGKVFGTFTNDLGMARELIRRGVRFVAHGSDGLALKTAYADLSRAYRSLVK